tara:strand:+ start:8787 stop:9074 length:288 start_codon:yes stop_codon:yes gene_type:complete
MIVLNELPDWYDHAKCTGLPIEYITIEFCSDCPVQANCLGYALGDADWFDGSYMPSHIWGGYTSNERRKAMKETGYKHDIAYETLINHLDRGINT